MWESRIFWGFFSFSFPSVMYLSYCMFVYNARVKQVCVQLRCWVSLPSSSGQHSIPSSFSSSGWFKWWPMDAISVTPNDSDVLELWVHWSSQSINLKKYDAGPGNNTLRPVILVSGQSKLMTRQSPVVLCFCSFVKKCWLWIRLYLKNSHE